MGGQILILSGPSGSGKSTLLSRALKEIDGLVFSISSTTRAPRDGEKNGVHYHFISEDEFKQGIDAGEFLEWANVHKNFYGTSLKQVKKALDEGKIVVFDIDVQGFKLAKEKLAKIITSVFITTINKEELKRRLKSRATDSDNVIENRLLNAVGEMEHINEYDYLIINDDLQKSYESLKDIISSMRLRANCVNVHELLQSWIGD